jgi:hypothetical protein
MPLKCTESNLNKYVKESTSLQPDTQGAQQENQETKHISHALERSTGSIVVVIEGIPIIIVVIERIPVVVVVVEGIPIVVVVVVSEGIPIFLECRP